MPTLCMSLLCAVSTELDIKPVGCMLEILLLLDGPAVHEVTLVIDHFRIPTNVYSTSDSVQLYTVAQKLCVIR